MKSGVMEEVKRSFKPEFINRIDDIIVFHQLNDDNMKQIVNLLASNLYKRCENQLGIQLNITPALKEHLVKNRDPKHDREIRELEKQGLVRKLWNAGSKVYLWTA